MKTTKQLWYWIPSFIVLIIMGIHWRQIEIRTYYKDKREQIGKILSSVAGEVMEVKNELMELNAQSDAGLPVDGTKKAAVMLRADMMKKKMDDMITRHQIELDGLVIAEKNAVKFWWMPLE